MTVVMFAEMEPKIAQIVQSEGMMASCIAAEVGFFEYRLMSPICTQERGGQQIIHKSDVGSREEPRKGRGKDGRGREREKRRKVHRERDVDERQASLR